MRISIRDDDPGYEAFQAACARGEQVHVLLDGIARTFVITADEEARTLVRAATDELGNVHFDRDSGAVITETLIGSVAIVTTAPDVAHA